MMGKAEYTESLEMAFRYVFQANPKQPKETLHRLIAEYPEFGEKLMTLEEYFVQEGYDKGHAEGREEGREENKMETARNLLKMGMLTESQIAEATQLPLETVQQLAKLPPPQKPS